MDRRYKTKNGYPIKVRFSHNYTQKLIDTGFYSDEKNWAGSRPKRSHPDYFYLTDKILKIEEQIQKAIYETDDIREAIQIVFGEEQTGFFERALKVIDREKGKNASLYDTALRSFQKYYRNYPGTQITGKMVQEYMKVELATRKPNGVHVYMRTLQVIWNKCYQKGDNPFQGVRPKLERTPNKALSDVDLLELQKAEFRPYSEAWHFRNYFLLMFYLGGTFRIVLKVLVYFGICFYTRSPNSELLPQQRSLFVQGLFASIGIFF